MRRPIIWLDGELVRAGDSLLHSLTPGVLKAQGVFETMRAEEGGIFLWERHWERMARGLKVLHLGWPVSREKIYQNIRRVFRLNDFQDARVRLTVWRESGRLRSSIVCQPLLGVLPQAYRRGFKAAISDVRHKKTAYSHIKSLDYHRLREAYLDAKSKGFDEAILLNSRGRVVEGSRTNVFFVKNRVLYTPPVRCGCLNGITRQTVIQDARRLGIPCLIQEAFVRDVLGADESFLTNSLIGVMPLAYLNTRLIGRGAVTLRLLQAYRQRVRESMGPRGLKSAGRRGKQIKKPSLLDNPA